MSHFKHQVHELQLMVRWKHVSCRIQWILKQCPFSLLLCWGPEMLLGLQVWVQKIWTQVCMERDLQQHERVRRTAWGSVIRMTFKCSRMIKVLHNRKLTHCSLILLILHPASGVIMGTMRMKYGDDAQHTFTKSAAYSYNDTVLPIPFYCRWRAIIC